MAKLDLKTYVETKQNPTMAVLKFLEQSEKMLQKAVQDAVSDIRKETMASFELSVNELVAYNIEKYFARNHASLRGRSGEHGRDGRDAKEIDEKQLVSKLVSDIQSQIKVVDGKDGYTPVAGVDFPSDEQVVKMVKLQVDKLPVFNEKTVLAKVLSEVKKSYPKLEIKGEDVVTKINALPLQPAFQIDASHIKNLPRVINKKLGGKSFKGGGGDIMQVADLSSQTDGMVKTFTVPYFRTAMFVIGSDFPSVLFLGNGFTVNAAHTQITLQSENAPSSGSQLGLIYIL